MICQVKVPHVLVEINVVASLNSLYTIGSSISRLKVLIKKKKVFYSVSVVDIISYGLNIGFHLGPKSAYCNESHGQGKMKNERYAEYKYMVLRVQPHLQFPRSAWLS